MELDAGLPDVDGWKRHGELAKMGAALELIGEALKLLGEAVVLRRGVP